MNSFATRSIEKRSRRWEHENAPRRDPRVIPTSPTPVAARTPDSTARIERAAETLSFAIPLALSAWGAGASMGFYDAPELAAAAHGIGVTHPPGHPLWVTLASVAAMLPVATLPYRVALFSGVCLGLVGRVVYSVSRRLAASALDHEALTTRADKLLGPIAALAVAVSATVGPATLRQATRVEVYALAGALAVAVLGVACSRALPPAVRARLSVLLVALGGANHHFIALTGAPIAIATVVARVWSADGASRRRALLSWAPLGVMGLLPYALLALRAGTSASLVRVRTAGDFVWTVTARAFQKNQGAGVPGTFGEHLLDVLDWIGASLSPLGVVMAFAGTFLTLRSTREEAVRADVLRLFGLATAVCLARALLGFVAGNPDAAGYLMPAIASVACLTTGFITVAWRAIRTAPAAPEGPTPGARALLIALLVGVPLALPVYLIREGLRATEPDRACVPEAAAESMFASLPPRAVVLAYAPETAFRARFAQRVEGERPDVTVMPVPFLPYPGMNNTLLARDADLLPLVRDYLAHGEARVDEVAALAQQRPVRLEVDPMNVLTMTPFLVPRGLLAEARGEPTTLASVRANAAAHFAAIDGLTSAMAEEPGGGRDEKTSEFVLWRNYNDALFFAGRGARAEALGSVRRALERAPQAQELIGLRGALQAPGDGVIDVRPYVAGARPQ